ncbi:HAD family hydrolase [Nocardia suismassiliense]|uniref:HAD family hydrolase n=1 Tax=Nocardia suismassiliense TaxID=2077092 RepID=UPI001F19BFA5|nr:hypothetical protein [Nocardia suismassiliense]
MTNAVPQHDSPPTALLPPGAPVLTPEGPGTVFTVHVGDMQGARAAEVRAVGVATGPCDAAELRAAGADVILSSLTEFPAWLANYRTTAHLS